MFDDPFEDDPAVAPLPIPVTAEAVREAKAPFARAVFVCGKCARKLGKRGFGPEGREPLRKALKRAVKDGEWKAGGKVRIVETACLDLCPKGRQAAATEDSLRRRRLFVVDPGASAQGVLTRLLGPPPA